MLRLTGCLLLSTFLYAQTTAPIIVNPQYLISNPTDTSPANTSWGSFKLSADFVPPFNYEFASILIGHHDWRTNSYTPRNSIVSSSSALLVGWDTPTDTDCIYYGCQMDNGQAGITVSIKAKNTYSPTVGLMVDVNPFVDNFNGVWGMNMNTSNAFKKNGGAIIGGEINIGLDDFATDIPNPGVPGQSIGWTITESSQNHTNKRVTTAWGMGYGGTQNFHHGWWAAANPNGQTPMDDLIHASGPITTVFDLSQVKSGPVALTMPPGGGIALGTIPQASALPPTHQAGVMYWCMRCARNTEPCAEGITEAWAISTGYGYRCY